MGQVKWAGGYGCWETLAAPSDSGSPDDLDDGVALRI